MVKSSSNSEVRYNYYFLLLLLLVFISSMSMDIVLSDYPLAMLWTRLLKCWIPDHGVAVSGMTN